MVFDRLHNNDGVVHDDADSQDQPEQCQVVETKAEPGHDGESADDSDRHGHERDDCRPPILKEQEHDQRHQDDGVAQRLHDLVD